MKTDYKQPLGAIITHFQLTKATESEISDIKHLLANHGVLVFREQQCTDEDFTLFLKKMGSLTFTVGEVSVKHHPNLNVVTNVGRKEPPKSRFHTDSSYFTKPPAYTALRAVTLPKNGGDTLFTNQYWAYETLPAEVKERLANRTFKHVVSGLDLSDYDEAEKAADHPVFLQHPVSGKTALYMSTPLRCVSVSGLEEEEGTKLISLCYEHSIQEANIYRHQWQSGDVVIWDNGCTLHKADHSQVEGDRTFHRGMSLGYNA
ncbi:MAG: TauD/TfdA family dioxygenase [Bacteroidota bacterium]